MRKIEDWDFQASHVQNDIFPGRFISSKTVLVAFGPPKFSMIARGNQKSATLNEVEDQGLTDAELDEDAFRSTIFTAQGSYAPVPVGLVQEMSMQQSRQISKIFEIGSDRAYHIPGRNFAAATINKILYDGPSLLKFAMVYYVQRRESGLLGGLDQEKIRNMVNASETVDISGTNRPGFDNFYINLASDLFNYPLGVLLYFKNNAGNPYGAVYLEDCFINQHGIGIQVGSSVIAESISLDFDRPVGVNVFTGDDDIE